MEKALTMEEMERNEKEFLDIFQGEILPHWKGADQLLAYLTDPEKSDFFRAPASARFHGAYPGGLCEHSLNVYHSLKDYCARPRVREEYGLQVEDSSLAFIALLHDLCKVNLYKPSKRNVKGEDGVWKQVDAYSYDDRLPYGHGEKSVYIIQSFISSLGRPEAFAIRYHMGFSGSEDKNSVSRAFELFPLAFALSVADMEATFFLEGNNIAGAKA